MQGAKPTGYPVPFLGSPLHPNMVPGLQSEAFQSPCQFGDEQPCGPSVSQHEGQASQEILQPQANTSPTLQLGGWKCGVMGAAEDLL